MSVAGLTDWELIMRGRWHVCAILVDAALSLPQALQFSVHSDVVYVYAV